MFNGQCVLKFKPRSGIYSNSTGSCYYDPSNEVAYSYEWWCFVKRIDGVLYFNDYNYSRSTSNHQGEVSSLLDSMGLKYVSIEAPAGLNKLNDCWRHYFNLICEVEASMLNPRLRTATYEAKLERINFLWGQLATIESLGGEGPSIEVQKEIKMGYVKSHQRAELVKFKKKLVLKESINLDLNQILNQAR